jgi:redox-sensing transcriptional repressor
MMVLQHELKGIPEPTLRRLPLYHRLLRRMAEEGMEMVSCTDIGRELKQDPTQVRKDLASTGAIGRPKVGYEVGETLTSIEEFLGWNNVREAFLVGVGRLGQALLGFERFNHHGLDIVAAFDTAPDVVGSQIEGHEVLPIEKMAGLARRMHVQLGIITVPEEAAQYAADLMVAGGIRAIWNFAPVTLEVPGHVKVQNEDLFASLAVLSRSLTAAAL